jgi:hypothetical protein
MSGENLNNVRRETIRHFREKMEYLKEKIMSLKQTVRQTVFKGRIEANRKRNVRITNLEETW